MPSRMPPAPVTAVTAAASAKRCNKRISNDRRSKGATTFGFYEVVGGESVGECDRQVAGGKCPTVGQVRANYVLPTPPVSSLQSPVSSLQSPVPSLQSQSPVCSHQSAVMVRPEGGHYDWDYGLA